MIIERSRQIHLDFHTSELIPDVGSRFDKRQFQDALKLGRVNLINLFAKCHHGWSYYPTAAGSVHPTLSLDLLGEQIEACHEIGVKAPIYYTVGWSVHDAAEHPEWCIHDREGAIVALNWDAAAPSDAPRPYTSWQFMCPSGGYLALMLAQTEELCAQYEVDGLWYDICNLAPVCFCETCRGGMGAEGVDLDDDTAVLAYSARKWKHFQAETTRIVHARHPDATLYYNGTTTLYDARRNLEYGMHAFNTKQDLEDLPTTWGGYDKFPLRARIFHNTGKPLVGMSGKFHTSWGEFGGFKYGDALTYEAASMAASGASCNFGDQLHPLGEMDLETYRLVGEAFAYVEQIEEYGVGARPVSNLGLWLSGEQPDDEGVCRMLLETQQEFVVVGPEDDLSGCAVIILPGARCLSEAQAAKLTAYVRSGGRLLVLGESALDAAGDRFLLDVGAVYVGPARTDVDFTVVRDAGNGSALGRGLVSSPFLNYEACLRCEPEDGTEALAAVREAYFSRTYGAFCSHRNTPPRPDDAAHPAALRKGNVVFLAHRLGRLYFQLGARVHRVLFANALALLHTAPMVATEMPSAGRLSLLHQPDHGRYVAHLLYAPALERGECLVIEDMPPLFDVPLRIRVPEEIQRAFLVPSGEELELSRADGAVHVSVPKVQRHQAVAFEVEGGAR